MDKDRKFLNEFISRIYLSWLKSIVSIEKIYYNASYGENTDKKVIDYQAEHVIIRLINLN